nr:MAG TPA: hypothetical protein [Caudoviricetes sp.]
MGWAERDREGCMGSNKNTPLIFHTQKLFVAINFDIFYFF